MSRIFLNNHSIVRHASYMPRIFLNNHSIVRHASYMSRIFLNNHSIVRHASYMSRIFLNNHSIVRHASYMSRIFLNNHSIVRHASYVSRIFLNNPVREPPERRLHEPCGMLLEECQAPKQDGMWRCENTVRVVPHRVHVAVLFLGRVIGEFPNFCHCWRRM